MVVNLNPLGKRTKGFERRKEKKIKRREIRFEKPSDEDQQRLNAILRDRKNNEIKNYAGDYLAFRRNAYNRHYLAMDYLNPVPPANGNSNGNGYVPTKHKR